MSFLTAAYAVSKKLGVTTEANNLTDQINAINDSIGADHGVNAEDALNNYAKAMAPITPITTGVTIAPLDDTIDLWGHKASDLQEDITITGNVITGKLIYTTEGALPEHWGPGYWLCLGFSDFPTGTTSTLAGVKPSYSSGYADVYEDSDHAIVIKIEDRKLQKVKAITVTNKGQSLTQTFDISGLEFVATDAE